MAPSSSSASGELMIFRFYKNSLFASQRKHSTPKRQSARTMLDAELKDIREKLRRIEEELAGNVLQFKSDPEKRAA